MQNLTRANQEALEALKEAKERKGIDPEVVRDIKAIHQKFLREHGDHSVEKEIPKQTERNNRKDDEVSEKRTCDKEAVDSFFSMLVSVAKGGGNLLWQIMWIVASILAFFRYCT